MMPVSREMSDEPFFFIRKDWMLYALLIGICSLLKNDDPGRKRGAIALVLAIVGLLTHEAFFFWGIPVVILALVRNKTTRTEGIVGLVIFAVIFAMTQ